jgi:hypothetical protein
MRRFLYATAVAFLAVGLPLHAEEKQVTVTLTNPLNEVRTDAPISFKLKDLHPSFQVRSVVVTCNGQEIPSQIDDLNRDGKAEELAFVIDMKAKESKEVTVTLSSERSDKAYPPRVFAELLLKNPKHPADTIHQTMEIESLTVLNDDDPYNYVHHHGPAFESELVGMRLYFDHRQTVDQYGKYRKGLEIKDTQFYTSKEQLAAGYGDDVLWAGNTVSVGTFRGWNGKEQEMITPVARRTESVLAKGPIRTVVEIKDADWLYHGKYITMTQRYTLYAGHRDVEVSVRFDEPMQEETFCTGTINVKGSTEYTDKAGLRGCWGADWAVGGADTLTHHKEAVGLAVLIPEKYIRSEEPETAENRIHTIGTTKKNPYKLHYRFAMASGNETFGIRSQKEWFAYLKQWKKEVNNPVTTSLKSSHKGKKANGKQHKKK